jgi:hypothetical protein
MRIKTNPIPWNRGNTGLNLAAIVAGPSGYSATTFVELARLRFTIRQRESGLRREQKNTNRR